MQVYLILTAISLCFLPYASAQVISKLPPSFHFSGSFKTHELHLLPSISALPAVQLWPNSPIVYITLSFEAHFGIRRGA